MCSKFARETARLSDDVLINFEQIPHTLQAILP